jgi:hypothetical protein
MNKPNDNTAPRRLRGWWAYPPRPGVQRLINPWEYRHLRAFGVTRVAGGFVAATAGIVCLSYAVYGWAAFFLALGALNRGWLLVHRDRSLHAPPSLSSRSMLDGASPRVPGLASDPALALRLGSAGWQRSPRSRARRRPSAKRDAKHRVRVGEPRREPGPECR